MPGLITNQCCCGSSSSSSSSSSLLSCACNAVGFVFTPTEQTIAAMNELVNTIISESGDDWGSISGFTLNAVGTCYGADPLGQIDNVSVHAFYTCCGPPGEFNDDLNHCYNLPPGQDLPPGKDLIENLVKDMADANGLDFSPDEGIQMGCAPGDFLSSMGCAFNDPVEAVVDLPFNRGLSACCAESTANDPVDEVVI